MAICPSYGPVLCRRNSSPFLPRAPLPEFHDANVRRDSPNLEPLIRLYKFIAAWDSIWHVPLLDQRSVMLKLMSALEPGGVFIFSAGGTDAPVEHTDSHTGPEVYYSTLGIPGILHAIQEGRCICKHLEFDQHPANRVYFIVQKCASLTSPT